MALAKIKNIVFKPTELRNQLGFKEEDIKIISEYQKKFPMLVNIMEYKEGDFIVDVEQIKDALDVSLNTSTWIKRMCDYYEFEEGVDFKTCWVKNDDFIFANVDDNINSMTRQGYKKQFLCTLDMAKQLTMVQKRNEVSVNARKYFILMEKCLREKVIWNTIRADEKELGNEFKTAFVSYLLEHKVTTVNDPLFNSFLAFGWDILNTVALGKTARAIKEERKILDKQTRDNLLVEDNKRLLFAQDRALVGMRAGVEPSRFITFLSNEVENKFGVNYYEEIKALNKQYTPLFSRKLITN